MVGSVDFLHLLLCALALWGCKDLFGGYQKGVARGASVVSGNPGLVGAWIGLSGPSSVW